MTSKEFWENRYEEGQTGWDVGYITPALKAYFDQIEDKNLKILIPGCGNAYEAEYLIRNGFTQVHVVDIAKAPLENLAKRLGENPNLHLIHSDFFSLNDQYDLIIEQTFFCALDPGLRTQYARKMNSLLKPDAQLAGIFFSIDFEKEGPPFGVQNIQEYHEVFEPYFHIEIEHNPDSIVERKGNEVFIILKPRKNHA